MANNKYELGNIEVQDIMRKPPHAFVLYGNIFILSILCLAIYSLNTFPIFEKENINIEIVKLFIPTNQNDSITIAISSNVNISKNIKKNERAKLFIKNIKFNKEDLINGEIDSVGFTSYQAPVLYFKCGRLGLECENGMIGNIEIITRKKTFLSMLLDRFKF